VLGKKGLTEGSRTVVMGVAGLPRKSSSLGKWKVGRGGLGIRTLRGDRFGEMVGVVV
jgi:hypothetical protein